MTAALWIVAVALIAIGVVGTVLPVLPGMVFVFAGILLAAWIDGFTRISGFTVGTLAVLAVLGVAIDYVGAAVSARRAGASGLAVAGAAIGTVAGVFTGLVGLIFLPLAGAFIGEFAARRDALRAGQVGLATWVGLLVAAALKIALVFVMLGVFIAALLL